MTLNRPETPPMTPRGSIRAILAVVAAAPSILGRAVLDWLLYEPAWAAESSERPSGHHWRPYRRKRERVAAGNPAGSSPHCTRRVGDRGRSQLQGRAVTHPARRRACDTPRHTRRQPRWR